jgi:serpin B
MARKLALPLIVAAALLAAAVALLAAAVAHSAGPRKLPATGSARAATGSTSAAVTATNALGLELLPRLGGSGNVVFSPYSIQTALAMLDQGAARGTAAQIDKLLGGQSASELAAANGALATGLRDAVTAPPHAPAADQARLLTADALWVEAGLPLERPFQTSLRQDFGAGPQAAHFATDPDAARAAINRWAAAHTAQLIKNLMPPGSITTRTALVLANAIYLKARWENPFVESSTANAPFFTAPGAHVSVPFMTESPFEARYGRGAGYEAIELPYADSTLSMLAVMPAQGTLPSFQRALTPASLTRIAGSLGARNVDLELPRLKLQLHTSLNQTLEALGMPAAFGPQANFSGITRKESLQIQQVEHGAYMRVDEAGTVAAAATGISTMPTAVLGGPTVHVLLNHPFLLFLRDDTTGAILFAGRVINPAQS